MTQAKKWNGSKWIRPERRLAIYLRDGFSCQYCGRDLKTAEACDINLDHLKPRSKGGSNESTNLVTSCKRCNSSRGAKSWRGFAPGGAIDRITRTVRRSLNIDFAKAILEDKTGEAKIEALR